MRRHSSASTTSCPSRPGGFASYAARSLARLVEKPIVSSVMCTSCNHHWHVNVNGKPGRIRVCTKCSSGTVVAQPSIRPVTASFPPMTGRFGPVDMDSWQSRNSTMSVETDFSIFRESFESDGTIDMAKRNSNSPVLGDQRSRNGSNPRFLYQDQWDHEELHRRAMLLQLTQPQSQRSPQGQAVQFLAVQAFEQPLKPPDAPQDI
ncbi:hypothetical protein Ae201684P_007287 [Aphanomyces euteiches]|nr:hypothetical protein Ae201684P_007287 [Aphanomyces euteiches]